MIANLSSMNTNVINKVAHLVYTGTVVKGMRVAGVVHEACNVAGGVRRLQELGLYIHLVELHREGRNAVTRAKSVRGVGQRPARIGSYLRSGTSPGYWLALCLWRRGRRHCWSFSHSAKETEECEGGQGKEVDREQRSCSVLRTVVGVVLRCCGPQRPAERPTCPSPVVRSPCRGTLSVVFGVSPGPTPSPELLHTHTQHRQRCKEEPHKAAAPSWNSTSWNASGPPEVCARWLRF